MRDRLRIVDLLKPPILHTLYDFKLAFSSAWSNYKLFLTTWLIHIKCIVYNYNTIDVIKAEIQVVYYCFAKSFTFTTDYELTFLAVYQQKMVMKLWRLDPIAV